MPSVELIYRNDPAAGQIPADVHYSPDNTRPSPIVIIFHAGGFVVGSSSMVPKPQIEELLDLGFVVIIPEYRLCPQVSVYEGPLSDAKACLAWVRKDMKAMIKAKADVEIDPQRVAVIGHSAGGNLALHMGSEPAPPNAILAMWPYIGFDDKFYTTPLVTFSSVQHMPEEFTNKIYEGPQAIRSPPLMAGGKWNLAEPRVAWMLSALRDGNLISGVVKDGHLKRVDPVHNFGPAFPPTCFIHGTEDVFAPHYLTLKAHKKLEDAGAQSKLLSVPDQNHALDIALQREDALFQTWIKPGLRFLADSVASQ